MVSYSTISIEPNTKDKVRKLKEKEGNTYTEYLEKLVQNYHTDEEIEEVMEE